MKLKRALSILLAGILISGCATTGNNGTSDSSKTLDVSGLSQYQKIDAYENQLIQTDEPYSTLTVLQSVRDYRTASLASNPLGIYAVDGVEIKKLPYKMFVGPTWMQHAVSMSLANVKIPAGKHIVEIGQITAWNTSDYTLPEMEFLPNTQYILVFEGGKDNRHLSVYTYEQDMRFSRLDRDSIILKDKVLTHKLK